MLPFWQAVFPCFFLLPSSGLFFAMFYERCLAGDDTIPVGNFLLQHPAFLPTAAASCLPICLDLSFAISPAAMCAMCLLICASFFVPPFDAPLVYGTEKGKGDMGDG